MSRLLPIIPSLLKTIFAPASPMRMLAHKNDEYHKEFNKLIGIDDVYCRELGGTRVMDKSHGWQAWEDIFAIKAAVETSGYKTRKDVEGAIQALEGMQMKNSLAHPQGGPRRHHRLLHQPGRERKVRGQAAYPERGHRQEHAATSQPVDPAGVI